MARLAHGQNAGAFVARPQRRMSLPAEILSALTLLLCCSWLFVPAGSAGNYAPRVGTSDTTARAAASSRRTGDAETAARASFGQLPLLFEANRGQYAAPVRFAARGLGYQLFLTDAEAVFALSRATAAAHPAPAEYEADVLRLRLVGASRGAPAAGADEQPGRLNYFNGRNPADWRTGVPTYARVSYRNVYPRIDLAYYGNQRQLEYDFVVAPGGDPARIALAFDGARGLRVAPGGDLVVRFAGGELRQHKPYAYQEADGVRRAVPVRYALTRAGRVRFRLGAYDHSRPLVIDPVLAYATYLGGNDAEYGQAVAIDAAGNAYVAGYTMSTDLPTTAGAYAPTFRGGRDAFVAKLNPAGTSLVYATYLGGHFGELCQSLAVDAAGQVYVTGETNSDDYPVTPGAFQSTLGGSLDVFVTKLNAAGSGLVYSTLVGGGDNEGGAAIAVDASGHAYVTGETRTPASGQAANNFPLTPGAFQSTHNGSGDGFVFKLRPDGTGLVYSTLFGGADYDTPYGLAVDAGGNAYVTGETFSQNFPVTPGAYQTVAKRSGFIAPDEAFVTKLNPTGSVLVYSTYLGGVNSEQALALAVDASGNAYVTGVTSSNDFPTTPGAFQRTQVSFASQDAFVTKLNAAGSGLGYSTYLGGSSPEFGLAIAVNQDGNAFVTGVTASSDFPLTADAYQRTGTAFLAQLNALGNAVHSTLFGPGGGARGSGLAVDASGNVYLTGFTGAGFTPTAGAAQATYGGGQSDGYVLKLSGFVSDTTATPTPTPTATPTPTPTPTPVPPPAPGTHGRIAFISERAGRRSLYAMNADGGQVLKLTNNDAPDADPAWSPDGTKIVFSNGFLTPSDLYVVNADGTNQTRLTTNGNSIMPSWSPDGAKIVFTRCNFANCDLWLVNADGTNLRALTSGANASEPAWSPDGALIAFSGAQNFGNPQVYVIKADGSNRQQLTSSPGSGHSPAWSPDGTQLAYTGLSASGGGIHVMNRDGSNQHRLTTGQGNVDSPAWSPDGTKIVFSSDRDGDHDLYAMNADGSGVTNLTNAAPSNFAPAWQPVADAGSAPATVQFSAALFNGFEGNTSALVAVTRLGPLAGEATVSFATEDDTADVPCNAVNGTAYGRCDYATTVDTLRFAPGEAQQTFVVPLIDDAYVEGSETLRLSLRGATGAALNAQGVAALRLFDNDSNPAAPNPILGRSFFVRQHYLDFLSREPEAGEPWTGVLARCPDEFNTDANSASAGCDRLTVSAAFFGSPEFQLKGGYVFRFYKVTFGSAADPNYVPAYAEIVADMRAVTGQTAAEVYAKKAAFADAFVQRPAFRAAYDRYAPSEFVDVLLSHYNLQSVTTPDPAQPDGAIKVTLTRAELSARLANASMTRAQVVRAVADSDEVARAEFNAAFVAMQYYGYLRRTPEPAGYQSWLAALQRGENFRTMVNGFMNSTEYKLRFGRP
ncbi:MAG TPA: SBBP repeat-containing protein [Pyrinomonadaceae bacterium]|jgi:Tol biopolymer transport system component